MPTVTASATGTYHQLALGCKCWCTQIDRTRYYKAITIYRRLIFDSEPEASFQRLSLTCHWQKFSKFWWSYKLFSWSKVNEYILRSWSSRFTGKFAIIWCYRLNLLFLTGSLRIDKIISAGTLLSTRNTRTSGMYWKFVSIRLIRIAGLMSSWAHVAQYVEHHPPSPSVRQSINFTWKLQKFISNLIISVLSEPSTPLAPADSDIILERCTSFFPPLTMPLTTEFMLTGSNRQNHAWLSCFRHWHHV